MQIVINSCFGGFSISEEARQHLGFEERHCDNERTNPKLIALIKEWGSDRVSGDCAELKIIEIPDDIDFVVCEYDGIEHIAEAHRTWN